MSTQLQWNKLSIFSWNWELPAGTPPGVEVAVELIDGNFEFRKYCYEVLLVSDKFIKGKGDFQWCRESYSDRLSEQLSDCSSFQDSSMSANMCPPICVSQLLSS